MVVTQNNPDSFTIELSQDEETKVQILAKDHNVSETEVIEQPLRSDLERMSRLPR